jgi:hypothetical protein
MATANDDDLVVLIALQWTGLKHGEKGRILSGQNHRKSK